MFDNNNKELLKGYLFDYLQSVTKPAEHNKEPSDLFNRPSQYICPFCNSGTGKNGTGAFTFYPDTNTYHCFACSESGDIFSLHARLNELSLISDFPRIIDDLEKRFNLPSSHKPKPTPKPKSTTKDYSKFFWIARQHLHETDYLTKRGISRSTQRAT